MRNSSDCRPTSTSQHWRGVDQLCLNWAEFDRLKAAFPEFAGFAPLGPSHARFVEVAPRQTSPRSAECGPNFECRAKVVPKGRLRFSCAEICAGSAQRRESANPAGRRSCATLNARRRWPDQIRRLDCQLSHQCRTHVTDNYLGLGRISSEIGQIWTEFDRGQTEFDQHGHNSDNFDPVSVKIGRVRPIWGRCRPKLADFGHIWQISAEFRPTSHTLGHSSRVGGRLRPNPGAEFDHTRPSGPRPKLRVEASTDGLISTRNPAPALGHGRPTVSRAPYLARPRSLRHMVSPAGSSHHRLRTESGRIRPNLTNSVRNRPNLGPSSTDLGPNATKFDQSRSGIGTAWPEFDHETDQRRLGIDRIILGRVRPTLA